MKQKILLFVFTLLTFSFSFASIDRPMVDWDEVDVLGITVALYPNPSSGVAFLEIKSEEAQDFHVKVVNLIGQEVMEQDVQANDRLQLDLRNVPAGVYFVQIEKGDEKITKRLIIR